MSYFEKVRDYVLELGHEIGQEIPDSELLIINEEEKGIYNMVLDCEGDTLIVEQVICEVPEDNPASFKRLLQINRGLVHGAFVLDSDAKNVIFRDTLQLENLDLNELEGSINALALGLVENYEALLEIAGAGTAA